MADFDIAVIGGGASGLVAAIEAKHANSNLKVAVIERLPRIGKKLLSTGNGRCNLTNENMSPDFFSGSCKKYWSIIENFSVKDFFESLGVLTEADDMGRVYPKSNTAASVLDGLRLEITKLGVEVITDFSVTDIKIGKNNEIISPERIITARSIILAGGGLSQSALGSDGSILRICKSKDIAVTKLSPALSSVKTGVNSVKSLKGLRVNASASLIIGGKKIKEEVGEVQFSDGTLSGICIFNLSTYCGSTEKTEIKLDLLPDMSFSEIEKLLVTTKELRKEAMLEDYLSGIFQKRIGVALLKQVTDKPLTEKTDAISNKEIKALCALIKAWSFPVTGVSGFEKSQVTRGGIAYEELSDILELNKYRNVYACGEILDICGDCGGYNLTFAFASGAYAGKNCAERISYDKN